MAICRSVPIGYTTYTPYTLKILFQYYEYTEYALKSQSINDLNSQDIFTNI